MFMRLADRGLVHYIKDTAIQFSDRPKSLLTISSLNAKKETLDDFAPLTD